MEICFYLGKPCRYGDDAPLEERMDCQTCPVYVVFVERLDDYQKLMDKRIAAAGVPKEQYYPGKIIPLGTKSDKK